MTPPWTTSPVDHGDLWLIRNTYPFKKNDQSENCGIFYLSLLRTYLYTTSVYMHHVVPRVPFFFFFVLLLLIPRIFCCRLFLYWRAGRDGYEGEGNPGAECKAKGAGRVARFRRLDRHRWGRQLKETTGCCDVPHGSSCVCVCGGARRLARPRQTEYGCETLRSNEGGVCFACVVPSRLHQWKKVNDTAFCRMVTHAPSEDRMTRLVQRFTLIWKKNMDLFSVFAVRLWVPTSGQAGACRQQRDAGPHVPMGEAVCLPCRPSVEEA